MKQHYEEEIAQLKHKVEEYGGPSFTSGASAAAMIQFPTPPNLENELQGFASGFTNLPAAHGMGEPSNIPYMKRPLEDESTYPRNVRAREEIPSRPHPSAPQPSSIVQVRPPQNNTSEAASKKSEAPGTGFDWLVVYNPKASRSIAIDLLHTIVHDNVVCCVRFSHDGKLFATGSNKVAAVYNVRTGEKIAAMVDTDGVVQDGDQYIRSVAFSPDGKYLATGCEDQIFRVWDISTQKLLAKFPGHSQDIYSVEFMPTNSNQVVSGSGDRTIKIWDIAEKKCIQTLEVDNTDAGKDAGITSVSVSPNGKYIAAGSLDRTIRLWDATTGKPLDTLEGHRDSVYSVSFAPDGRHLISGSLDKTIKVWQFDSSSDIQRGTCKYTILGHKDFVLSVAGTPPDGRWIVSGSKDRSVQFWDSLTGTTQLMLQGHKNSVISVAISPHGTYFATGSGDYRARIWSYSNMEDAAAKGTASGTSSSAPSLRLSEKNTSD
ncbi:Transcriptional repressor TUP1 [Paramicrosporidium saccamoebae]|uniref:Transcriptional repressor TUP1 n=1 Tax=Paramicrosporidium saccamoebae TaxID=1246581 RepID=A0A2H9TMY0_9FUNG|nr:Transcriptional repressor TUP1 [Paramicrosporidium saccamoebae]